MRATFSHAAPGIVVLSEASGVVDSWDSVPLVLVPVEAQQ
jgi:hypothetical protein